MAIRPLTDDFMPYTSINAMQKVIERCRAGRLPEPLNEQGLQQIGVQASMASTTLRTLLFLGLADEGGNSTEALAQIRKAPTGDYPALLADIVKRAYLKVFAATDPTTDSESQIADAFRPFDPPNQRDKMIRLFLGLCEEAGIIPPNTTRKRNSTPGQSTQSATRPRQAVATADATERAVPASPQPLQPQAKTGTPNLKGKEITLTTGDGRIHLGVYYDDFTISDEDLAFVRGLIKQLIAYEAKSGAVASDA